jgi:hypothetical protein
MRKLNNKWVIITILYLILLISSFAITYAYYVSQKAYGITLQTGEFEVEIFISFDNNAILIDSPYYDQEKNVVLVNSYDSNSENYIGKLKISVLITPAVAARVRFKIMDEWELTRTYLDQNPEYPVDPVVESIYHTAKDETYYPFSLLKVDPTFDVKFDLDSYAYLNDVLQHGKPRMIHLIDGGDRFLVRSNNIFEETVYIKLGFLIEVVQANRIVELWGIDQTFYTE